MRRIAVLTSGGDAPGMNAAIRAVVRYSINQKNFDVFGVERGYEGLVKGLVKRMDSRSVSDTIRRGGTMLKTARCPEFVNAESRELAYEALKAYGIEGLVVIGGDGSFKGMSAFSKQFDFPCVGIPATIDNDLGYTDFSLGFDTAVNTVLSAMNNIRDTMTSHDRVCIVEVMGRHSGDIAIYSGLAGGCEFMLVPEVPFDISKIVAQIKRNIIKGKASDIIVLAEGVCDCEELKKQIKDNFNMSIRTIKLGYIQRGGAPSMADRVLASRCAVRAVDVLQQVGGARVVGIKGNKIIDEDVEVALATQSEFSKELYVIANSLS
jgi:6-phosphofructokinase 1